MVISWCKREIDSLHGMKKERHLLDDDDEMAYLSIECGQFPFAWISQNIRFTFQVSWSRFRKDMAWMSERDRNRWSFCQEESLVVILILESIDSNTNEKVHLVHHFLRQSHSELQCSAMLKMTLLWIFPFNEAIKSSL